MDRVCRTCMRIIDFNEKAISINDSDLREKLQACLPEVVLDNVVDPKMCGTCSAALSLSFRFKGMCNEAEKTINTCIENKTSTGKKKPLNETDLLSLGRRDTLEMTENEDLKAETSDSIPKGLESLQILSDVASQATKAGAGFDYLTLDAVFPSSLPSNWDDEIKSSRIERNSTTLTKKLISEHIKKTIEEVVSLATKKMNSRSSVKTRSNNSAKPEYIQKRTLKKQSRQSVKKEAITKKPVNTSRLKKQIQTNDGTTLVKIDKQVKQIRVLHAKQMTQLKKVKSKEELPSELIPKIKTLGPNVPKSKPAPVKQPKVQKPLVLKNQSDDDIDVKVEIESPPQAKESTSPVRNLIVQVKKAKETSSPVNNTKPQSRNLAVRVKQSSQIKKLTPQAKVSPSPPQNVSSQASPSSVIQLSPQAKSLISQAKELASQIPQTKSLSPVKNLTVQLKKASKSPKLTQQTQKLYTQAKQSPLHTPQFPQPVTKFITQPKKVSLQTTLPLKQEENVHQQPEDLPPQDNITSVFEMLKVTPEYQKLLQLQNEISQKLQQFEKVMEQHQRTKIETQKEPTTMQLEIKQSLPAQSSSNQSISIQPVSKQLTPTQSASKQSPPTQVSPTQSAPVQLTPPKPLSLVQPASKQSTLKRLPTKKLVPKRKLFRKKKKSQRTIKALEDIKLDLAEINDGLERQRKETLATIKTPPTSDDNLDQIDLKPPKRTLSTPENRNKLKVTEPEHVVNSPKKIIRPAKRMPAIKLAGWRNSHSTCEHCGRVFKYISHLKVHRRSHLVLKLFKCELCDKSFSMERYLDVHMALHFSAGDHQCLICNRYFSSHHVLKKHQFTHTGIKPHVCKLCDRRFTQRVNLETHMRTHTGCRDFICYLCNSAFGQKVHLIGHMRTHTGEKPFACNLCPKAFAKSTVLRYHKALHASKPYMCSTCHTMFKDETSYNRHVKKYSYRSQHTTNRMCSKIYDCGICNKYFISTFSRNRHMKVHVKDLIEAPVI